MKIVNLEGSGQSAFSLQSDWEKNIGTGLDYTSITSAISALERKTVSYPKLTLDAGTYSEKILDGSEKLLCTALELVGDTRTIVSSSYVDGLVIKSNDNINGGVGTCSLSNSGNDIAIIGATTNPDFAELVASDKIIVIDNSNNVSECTISSVSANVLTLSAAAPSVGSTGSSVTILPNRKITYSSSLLSGNFLCKVKLTGFYLDIDADVNILNAEYNQAIELNNCTFNNNGRAYAAVKLNRNSLLFSTNSIYSNVSFINSSIYALDTNNSTVVLQGLANLKTLGIYLTTGSSAILHDYFCTANGLNSANYSSTGSSINLNYFQCHGYYRGLYSFIESTIWADDPYIANCNIGIYANVNSSNYCRRVTWVSNSTNASPASSGSTGNSDSINVFTTA